MEAKQSGSARTLNNGRPNDRPRKKYLTETCLRMNFRIGNYIATNLIENL